MSANGVKYGVGVGGVGSGIPYMSGDDALAADTQVAVEFPRVTKSVTVINKAAADLRVYFADHDAATFGTNVFDNQHYITLDAANDSVTMHIRCRRVYIHNMDAVAAGSYEVFAELSAARDEMDWDTGYLVDGVATAIPGIND
tara:strand:+ start:480 stop:908 length:429 start_codon:yes stop_codon:yes gene_type:complete